MASLSVDEFLDQRELSPIIDVRSPAEFAHAHIPGSSNIPLLDDDQRAEVGTIYVKRGRNAAVERGLELVAPSFADKLRLGREVASGGELLIYCWRGGMRSGIMAWLFEVGGISSATLDGGYKAYRRELLEAFAKPAKIITLGGLTGCGKTAILQALELMGEQVVDLEALANHKGSAFGALGQDAQPTTMQFENNLFDRWRRFDYQRPIWLEDESKRIGDVQLPESLYERKQSAPVVEIQLPISVRVERLVAEYAHFDPALLSEGVKKISKRLGGLRTKVALSAIAEGNMHNFIATVLEYYDHYYGKSLAQRESKVHPLEFEQCKPRMIAKLAKEYVCDNLYV